MKAMLDLGCGKSKEEGFIGLNLASGGAEDIISDVEKRIPFKDNSIDYVKAHFVFSLRPGLLEQNSRRFSNQELYR